jgi:lysophospholipid acyltransferase (LPLAT)-like uncharacterized protein
MKIRSRVLTRIVGWLAVSAFRALTRTLHMQPVTEADGIDPAFPTPEGYIYALWHDSILIPLGQQVLHKKKTISALVSRHRDGAYLTLFMRHLGIRSVCGSTARGGDQALRELMRLGKDWHIYITPDGPRGPHHEIKPGLVFLASHTGRPIVPTVSLPEKSWYIRGKWTGMCIPRPFTRAWFLLGEPIRIPPNLSREQIEFYTQLVQSEMHRAEQKLARLMKGEEIGADAVSRAA